MEYRYSSVVPAGTYDTKGLCGGIPLRRNNRPLSEDIGAIRAQEDWSKLVGPLKNFTGGLAWRFGGIQTAIPECIPDRLETVSYANELAFIYDDFTELFDQAQLEKANDEMQAAFLEGLKPGSGSGKPPTGLRRLQLGLFEEMRRIDAPRAKVAMLAWVEFLRESAGRSHEVDFATLDQYLPYRILDVGEMVLFAIVTFGMGLDIPKEDIPALRAATPSVWAAMALQNDIFSYEKEVAAAKQKGASSVVNALYVLMKEHNCDLEEATRICKEKVIEHIDIYKRNLNDELTHKRLAKDTRAYMEACLLMVSANAAWSVISRRYNKDQEHNAFQKSMMEEGLCRTLGGIFAHSNVIKEGTVQHHQVNGVNGHHNTNGTNGVNDTTFDKNGISKTHATTAREEAVARSLKAYIEGDLDQSKYM